ncbi:MAG: DUF1853 family protein [Bacteroidota bacterium]
MSKELTGFESFQLSTLKLASLPNITLPTDRRLGHLFEKVVSEGIKASSNFEMIAENIQLIEEKQTIGELDFLIRDKLTSEVIHLELAYKFYLYDSTISELEIENWIGPNRNDSLIEKLKKLKEKQFPLLYHPIIASKFPELQIEKIRQKLCLISNLYVPFKQGLNIGKEYHHFIKGFYYYFSEFESLTIEENEYFIPPKRAWGINPSQNEEWISHGEFLSQLEPIIEKGRSPLCWQKTRNEYSEFFVVSW